MAEIDTGEISLFYEQFGSGPDLLLIMGLGAPGNMWEPVLPYLTPHFRVTTFDNRGVGRSGCPEGPYTMAQMARDAIALLDALGIERTHVVGISMGGMIAQHLALEAPERVERLVLAATSAGGPQAVRPEPWVIELLTRPRAGKSSLELIREAAPILFAPGFIERHPEVLTEIARRNDERPTAPEGVQNQILAIVGHDVADRLREITAPTLVVTGDADVLVPPQNSAHLAAAIPGAQQLVLPGVAHGLLHEATERFAEAIRSFCLEGQLAEPSLASATEG
ncbi:MAG: alpha/beta fold hydrolase [Planctomycetota bacterium]|nr:MAG: alpha/beta fold hydrolase [Planctomycetota bacterium]